MNNFRFFTTGYTGKRIEDLKPLLATLNAILVDVRFYPESRQVTWQKSYLKILHGAKYRHVGHLGNRTYRENKITIQHLELGIRTITSWGVNAVLLCGCAEAKACHRWVIAEELRRKGFATEELESWKVAETTLF